MKTLIEQFYDDDLKRKPNDTTKKNHKPNIITVKKSRDSEVVENVKVKKHK